MAGPWRHANRFIIGFQIDVTSKPSGQRMRMEEMAPYTVEKGKIVREGFFYIGGAYSVAYPYRASQPKHGRRAGHRDVDTFQNKERQ